MSYLNDEPLSKEEMSFIRRTERYENYQSVPPPLPVLNELKVPYTSNRNFDACDQLPMIHTITDYFKIDIRRKPNAYLLNTTTYHKLMQLIKSRYGMYPHLNLLECSTISIVPCPGGRCSLYYQAGENISNDSNCNFELVGTFVADGYFKKYCIACPFNDSVYSNKNVYFNWYGNDKKTGKIVPKVNRTDFMFLSSNTCMPWVSNQLLGSYYIDGICDAIGFYVTFHMPDNTHVRNTPSYRRSFKVKPRRTHLVGPPGDVQYEVEELSDYDGPGDPLLDAFQH